LWATIQILKCFGKPTEDPYCFRYVTNGLAERQDEPEVQGLLDRLNQR